MIMENVRQSALGLQKDIGAALTRLHFEELAAKKAVIDNQVAAPDFWNEPQSAQEVVKQQAKLERRLAPWLDLKKDITDIVELSDIDDASLRDDLAAQLTQLKLAFVALKDELKLAGPYDDYDAIVSVYAGAGGTDAQDWAQMLLRMYVRWAEKNDLTVTTIEESAGDEAGIKSATLEISGSFAYGKLKGEHGVHRLVRPG
jgi:peptide chain release factor 2